MAKRNESLDVVPAAGFILFRRNDDSNLIEFLLLQSKSGKYGTPKGHVEKPYKFLWILVIMMKNLINSYGF